MIKILFVCYGNICRSPMAEFVMKNKVEAAGLADKIYVESAATSTDQIGEPVYPDTREILARHGIECVGKTARQMTRADYGKFDYLIGMDSQNIRNMHKIVGKDPENKIRLLLDFTDKPGDIDDPWYHRDFDATYELVDKGCEKALEAIRKTLDD